jgi:hypothetical protein
MVLELRLFLLCFFSILNYDKNYTKLGNEGQKAWCVIAFYRSITGQEFEWWTTDHSNYELVIECSKDRSDKMAEVIHSVVGPVYSVLISSHPKFI